MVCPAGGRNQIRSNTLGKERVILRDYTYMNLASKGKALREGAEFVVAGTVYQLPIYGVTSRIKLFMRAETLMKFRSGGMAPDQLFLRIILNQAGWRFLPRPCTFENIILKNDLSCQQFISIQRVQGINMPTLFNLDRQIEFESAPWMNIVCQSAYFYSRAG